MIKSILYPIRGGASGVNKNNKKKPGHINPSHSCSRLKGPRLRSIGGFKTMSKPDQRYSEQPRATPKPSRWHPCVDCGDARAQLISHVKAMEPNRTGLWDMQRTLWEVHAKDTVLRSSRVGKKHKKKSVRTRLGEIFTCIPT